MKVFPSAHRAVHGAMILLIVCFLSAASKPARADGTVNVYSSRGASFVGPILKLFENLTGVKTNVTYHKRGLVDKLAAEGASSQADIILANQFITVIAAKDRGLTQPAKLKALEERILPYYRDPEGHWFGLSRRARIIFASKARVKQDVISYEDLADPKWQGRICIRSAKHPYNIVLISYLIVRHGEAWTEKWLAGLKSNLAKKPAGGDRSQAENIYDGKCDIALANSYYMGAMATNEKQSQQKDWAAALKLIFPKSDSRGAHVSISAMALAKHAPNKKNAILLMDFLSSKPAQFIYALENHEYPIRQDVPPSALVAGWGAPEFDEVALNRLANLTKDAQNLVDNLNFDEGPSH